MTKLVTEELVIDGFKSNDVDFPACLQRSPRQQDFVDKVVLPLVATMTSAADTAVLLIIAHSDRVDDQGPDREQRRARELDVSVVRAQSALDEVVRRVQVELAAQGRTVEDQMKARVQLIQVPSGAANLAVSGPSLDALQREANRRVTFSGVRFVP